MIACRHLAPAGMKLGDRGLLPTEALVVSRYPKLKFISATHLRGASHFLNMGRQVNDLPPDFFALVNRQHLMHN